MNLPRLAIIFIFLQFISACGGGGDETSSPQELSLPQNMAAQSGDGQVILSWTARGDVAVEIHRSDVDNFFADETNLLSTTTVGASEYVDDNVNNDASYYYRIIAIRGQERSPASAIFTGNPTADPQIPQGLAVSNGNNSVGLSWGAISAEAYEIHRGNTSGFTPDSNSLIFTTEVAANSYQDNDVLNGNIYHYRIIALKGERRSAPSDSIEGRPMQPPALPTTPQNLGVVNGDQQVQITWTAIADEQYEIHSGGGLNFVPSAETLIFTTGLGVSSYTHTGLNNDAIYYYRVIARKGGNTSTPSDGIEGRPTAPPSVVSIGVENGDSQVTLNWTAVATEQYEIHKGTATGFTPGAGTLIHTTAEGIGTYTDTGLTNDDVYYYRIVTVKGALRSAPSGTAEGQPTAPPTVVSIGVENGDSQVTLNWTAVATELYEIHKGATTGFTPGAGTLIHTTAEGIGTYTDTGLTNDDVYYYRIITVKGALRSAPSETAEGRPSAPPAIPTGLNAVSGDAQVSLSWIAIANLQYEVHRGASQDFAVSEGTLIHTTAAGENSYLDTTVINSNLYYYRILVVNGTLKSLPTDSVLGDPVAATAPPPPTFELQGRNGDIQINMTSAVADSYKVYFNTTGNVTKSDTVIYDDTFNFTTHLGLTNLQVYYYRVSAVTGGQESVLSEEKAAFPYTVKTSWTPSYPSLDVTATAWLLDVVYTGTRYIAVGRGNTIMRSDDNITWTATTGGTRDNRMLAHDGAGIVIMATSQGIYRSDNHGQSFTRVSSPGGLSSTSSVDAVFYDGNNFTAFIGISFLTSTDGLTWQRFNTSALYGYNVKRFNGTYYAIAYDLDNNKIISSTDGQNWSAAFTAPANVQLDAVSYANGIFYSFGYDTMGAMYNVVCQGLANCTPTPYQVGYLTYAPAPIGQYYRMSGNRLWSSANGVNWTTQRINVSTPLPHSGIKWIDRGVDSHLIAFGIGPSIISSNDGVNWYRNFYNGNVNHIIWGENQFLMLSAGYTATSSNGLSWTFHDNDYNLRHVEFDGQGYIATGSQFGKAVVAASPDGINWSPVHIDAQDGYLWQSVSNGTHRVAVGSAGMILTDAPDGVWKTANVTPATVHNFRTVAWDGEAFVAVPYIQSGTSHPIYRSTNGVDWSVVHDAGELIGGVVAQDGVFKIAALGKLLTSPDGIEWTSTPINMNIYPGLNWDGSVYWAGTRYISPDGIHWSEVAPANFGLVIPSPVRTISFTSSRIYR